MIHNHYLLDWQVSGCHLQIINDYHSYYLLALCYMTGIRLGDLTGVIFILTQQ